VFEWDETKAEPKNIGIKNMPCTPVARGINSYKTRKRMVGYGTVDDDWLDKGRSRRA
jgi:hypothetical protein